MKGKNKCRILKQIRQKIADENEIPYVTRECEYRGDCSGTCPRCEAELQYLERELEKRRRLGKTVAVAAVAAGLSLSLSACVPKPGMGAGGADPTLPSPVAPKNDPEWSSEAPLAGMISALPPELEGEPLPPVLEGELPAPEQPTVSEELTAPEGDVVWTPESPEDFGG